MDYSKNLVMFIMAFILIGTGFAKAEETKVPEGSKGAVKIEYKAEDFRDPFQNENIEIQEEPQAPAEPRPLPVLEVQGIIWGGNFPQAIINSKVLGIGDTIEGVRIIDINNSRVIVSFDRQKYNLSTISAVATRNEKPQETKMKP
jgi:hypothetical protein